MSIKVFKTNNYITVDIPGNIIPLSDHKFRVFINPIDTAAGSYLIESEKIGRREVLLSELTNEAGTPYTLTTWTDFFTTNTGFDQGGASPPGSIPWNYTALNYDDLINNIAPTATEGELSIVYNSQGLWLINRKLKGIYIYQTSNWVYANQELQDRIQSNATEISGKEDSFFKNSAFNKNFGTNANEVLIGNTRVINNLEITKLSNTSGSNTGDETTLSIQTKRPLKTIGGESLEGLGDIPIKQYIKDELILTSISNNFSSNAPTDIPGMTYTISGLTSSRDFIFYAVVLTNNDQNEELDFYIAKNGTTDLNQLIIETQRKNQDQSIQGTFNLDGLVNGDVITFQFNTRNDNVDIETRRIIFQSWA